jgi:hypothetical protein
VLLNVCKILNEIIFVDQYFEATKEKTEREITVMIGCH